MAEENMEQNNEKSQPGNGVNFNPFPGLRPFKIEESHLFFGREGQSDEVLLKLSKNRFVGVIGPSGSGKSSFVYCGVLPILYGGFLTEVSADWEVVVMRPGAGPIDNLAESLLRSDAEYRASNPEEKRLKRTIISTLLRSSSLGLVEAIDQLKKTTKKNYLVLVDQFEELFRFKDSRDPSAVDETLAFINLILEAVNHKGSPIYVSITMRSDFIGECAQFAELTKKINDSNYLIPQMTREQKRRAIEGPVAVGHAQVTTRLVQRLLNDLGDNPDQLPILQHSLMRTWDYWSKFRDSDEEPLDIKHYEAIGTMSEALSLHANEAFDELNEKQKIICEQLFKAITERRGENFGIRRPTRMGDIAAIAQVKPEEVAAVVEKFRAPGRSLLMPAVGVELTIKSVIDISHESLMRIWVRLKNWVEDEADAVQMYMRLSEAAQMYQMGKAGLWRPPDLQLALNWEAKHKPTLIWAQRYHPAFERTMEFLSHSKKEYETEQRIKELQAKRRLKTARVTAMVMAGLCVVAIGFLLYAFDQQAVAIENAIEAKMQEEEALKQKSKADSNALIAQLNEAEALKQEQAAKDSAEVARIQRDSAAAARAKAEENFLLAQENERQAKANERMANIQKDSAELAREEALVNFQDARRQEQIAIRRQYLSTAKAVALKSINMPTVEAFRNIKGLLAQQAYHFNTIHEGYEYESSIYNSLYYALASYDDNLAKTEEDVYNFPGDILLAAAVTKNVIYSVHQNGHTFIWKADGLNRTKSEIMPRRTGLVVAAASISPDDSHMLIAGRGVDNRGYAEVIDLNNVSNKTIIENLGAGVIAATYAKDGSIYLLDDNGYSIKQWRNGTTREVKRSAAKLTSLTVTTDNNYIYTATDNGKLLQWNVRNNYEMVEFFSGKTRITAIEVDFSGDIIAFGDQNGLLYLKDGDRFNQLPSHEAGMTSIVFSRDGKFMATASHDESVRLWNLKNLNAEPIELVDHNDKVSDISFTTDNSQIMASTYTREIKFWPTNIEQMSDQICGHVTENLSRDDWDKYIGGVDYERTCPNLPETLSDTEPDEESESQEENK